MKKIALISTMLSLALQLSAQFNVINTEFFSPVLNKVNPVRIYLPPDYYNNPNEDYPVIYFLHGAQANHTSYPEMITWTQNLILNGIINPVIVVFANGACPPYWGSCYTNSVLYGDYEDYLAYDLVTWTDTSFRTIPERQYRCISGHSMGGYGSAKLAIKHPDIYRGFVSHAGIVNMDTTLAIWHPHILEENGNTPPYTYTWGIGTFTNFTITTAGAYSPNLNNPPLMVNFIFDENGNFIDSVYNMYMQHDISTLIKQITPAHNLGIYFSCGTNDNYYVYPANELFRDTLEMLGLDYIFYPTDGDHALTGELISSGMQFLDSLMFIATGTNKEITKMNSKDLQSFLYPNPTKDKLTISSPGITGLATLSIFNVSGEKVLERQLTNNETQLDISALPRGVYFVRLQDEKKIEVTKLIKQ